MLENLKGGACLDFLRPRVIEQGISDIAAPLTAMLEQMRELVLDNNSRESMVMPKLKVEAISNVNGCRRNAQLGNVNINK